MNCPSCGNQVADGSMSCPVCGAALIPSGGMQPQYQSAPQGFDSMQQGGMQPQYQAVPQSSGGNKTGLIIGIIVAAVAVIALVLCLVLGVFSGKDGTYVCNDYAAFGMDVTLEVDGDNFTLTMNAFGETETESGTIKFKGDKVELTAEGETIEGDYSKKDKTITIEGMTFKKK
ncbi:MAG: zinc ribbon domain-containing protein [Lachnospiraceae bacterium]|nr:zinc ribbon domain-containing protein [Lachnospiraceae bacterium]